MVKRVEDSAVIKIMKPVASVSVVEPLVKPTIHVPHHISHDERANHDDVLHSPSSHSSNSSFFSTLRLRKPTNGWFKDFTRTERTLSISLLFSIGLLLFFFTIILFLLTNPKNKLNCKNFQEEQNFKFNFLGPSLYGSISAGEDESCLKPLCVAAGMIFIISFFSHEKFPTTIVSLSFSLPAADIMKRIDKNVDPCEDFYKFSCGGLDNKMNLIPEDKSSLSTASLLQTDIDKKLRGLIDFQFVEQILFPLIAPYFFTTYFHDDT